jgi:tetratricopeptide (TPR) repeat protein
MTGLPNLSKPALAQAPLTALKDRFFRGLQTLVNDRPIHHLPLVSGSANCAHKNDLLPQSRSRRFDLAEKYFAMALEHYPDFEEAHVGMARTLFGLGKHEQALGELQTAIKLNPNDEVAWYRLSQVPEAWETWRGSKRH